ncbi:hypothetical protein [Victivallis sp. Marseille-Q1083]|uniref:hypothetical protein n=1 Tax=Victivallis sp. Marseille-Q1083 TaxID=2717288 RepID=UPI00158ED18D|nr:hypothetical protein [Victivallis sp. Marseille-Q1083]
MKHNVTTIQCRAEQLKLAGRWKLCDNQRADAVCNGIGAGWFPPWLRFMLDQLHPALVPVAWIHDLDYDDGGRWTDRWIADWRFLRNGVRAAFGTYAVDQMRRYVVMVDALRFFVLLRIGGAPAFRFTGLKARKK